LSKSYFIINLNKGESAETKLEIVRERVRWTVFIILFMFLIGFNVRVFMINLGYNSIIEQKKVEIIRLESEIKKLESSGKNLSKKDIMSLAELEESRFLWANNINILGNLTPRDISITGLRFKKEKFVMQGIAITFEDKKDFEIIDEYVQTLRRNKKFSENFSNIKYLGHQRLNVRGQDIIKFEVMAKIQKNKKNSYL
tara:strand:+ start:383 stop:976 length:594 start_codon:yes stop_codon:yes gene_type:complete